MFQRNNVLPLNQPRKRDHGNNNSSNNNNTNKTRTMILPNNVKILLAFLFGVVIGRGSLFSTTTTKATTTKSSIQHLEDLPVRNTSHANPVTGKFITKKQFLEPFVVPRVTGFSVATIEKGESVQLHSHPNMHEFFLVLSGEATFWMCGDGIEEGNDSPAKFHAKTGTFYHAVPHCVHGIDVAANSTHGDLKMLVTGVVDDAFL